MVELDQYRSKLAGFQKPLAQIKQSLDLDNKEKRIQELEASMEAPGFWDDPDSSQVTMKELKNLKSSFERFHELEQGIEDAQTLIEMAEEENDTSLIPDVENEVEAVEKKLEDLRIETLLSGEYDRNNAILTLHAGAGGTEAQDWVQMLFRMYTRYCEKMKFKVDVVDSLAGDEAGIKSITFIVEGENAYGYLKAEKGVHRLVRISPFDANKRRHTSFASVAVMPDIEDEIDIEINEKDLRIDTYRASGAGGQHINKTDSAVRITHIPTGIVVTCQNERSQHKNKAQAMKVLKARLYELEEEKKNNELDKIAGEKDKIDFGSQIRNYVLHPYKMVKDVRTNYEVGNAEGVLDGDLNGFMNAFLSK